MELRTFILRTETQAVFLSNYGFITYDIVDLFNCKDNPKNEYAINKIDITSWQHQFDFESINSNEILFCRVDLKEFVKRHTKMYKEWKKLPLGFRTEKEQRQQEKQQFDLYKPLHNWVNSFKIDKQTEHILNNEVYLRYCSRCDKLISEEDERYIEEESETMCTDCTKDFLSDKYKLRF